MPLFDTLTRMAMGDVITKTDSRGIVTTSDEVRQS